MEIVFDFDGTIADTLDMVVKILNRLAPEYGYPELTEEDIMRFKKLGSKKARKAFGVSWLQFIRVGRRVQKLLNAEIPNIKMFPGMKKVFTELKKSGLTLGIISSDTKKNIYDFLNKNDLENIFEYVVPTGLMWGKARKLRRIKKKRNLNGGEIIYIGDETKDIIACRKAKVRVMAVTWGYNSESALKRYKPEWIVRKPEEIVKTINCLK